MPANFQNNQIKSVGGIAHTRNPQYKQICSESLQSKNFYKKKKEKNVKKSPGLYPVIKICQLSEVRTMINRIMESRFTISPHFSVKRQWTII